MSFDVQLAPSAEADLERLFDFLLDRAETTEDLDRAQAAIEAIRAAAKHRLAITPFSFRKAALNSAQRELMIPFGGCVTGRYSKPDFFSPGSARQTLGDRAFASVKL